VLERVGEAACREPAYRAQLAQAVGHVGLIDALRRITGCRTAGKGTGER